MSRLALPQPLRTPALCIFFLLLIAGGTTPAWAQITITRTSSSVFYFDTKNTPQLTGMYAAYQIQNSGGTAYEDLWVSLGSFTGSTIGLAPNEDGLYHLGALGASETKYAFFYLTGSAATATAETHTVAVYDQKPPATALTSSTFTLTSESTQGANANKVTTTVTGPNPGTLGGIITITVTGQTGTIGGTQIAAYTPAAEASWPADSYKLVSTSITFTGGNTGTYTNQLFFTFPSSAASDYEAVYTFQATGITTAPSTVSPVAYIQSGNPIKHTSTSNFATLAPVQPAENTTTLSKSVSPTSIGGGVISYMLTLDNTGTNDVTVDELRDVLPAAATYILGSSTYGGGVIDDPVITGSTLAWQNTFTVPASSSVSLTFQVTLPNENGTYTNSVTGYIGEEQIDTTVDTADDAPATASVTVYADADLDGLPNYVEGGGTDPEADHDTDGTPNYQDPEFPGFTDTNNDGINDAFDADLDGYANHLDLDSDGDGLTDGTETGPDATNPRNSDTDSLPDYLDVDSDGDGITDLVEAQPTSAFTAPSGADDDGDGLDNAYDANDASTDLVASAGLTPYDFNEDDEPDHLDTDSDNDLLEDATEGHDTNGNGTIDGSERAPAGTDSDGDGLDDGFEGEFGTSYAPGNALNASNGVTAPATDFPNTNSGSEPDFRGASTLPVELAAFSATTDSDGVTLHWETASEAGNAGFFVERAGAAEGQPFAPLAWIEGHGTTSETQRYRYRAANLEPGRHVFRLKQVDVDGTFAYSTQVEASVDLAGTYHFSAAYPNPFNPQTQFSLAVKTPQHVTASVFDVTGRRVAVLYRGHLEARQSRTLRWDAGQHASGLYLIRVTGEHFSAVQRVTLIK